MSEKTYDVLVIGAGPGGYVAAFRAAQLGLKAGLVEKSALGGTCLNVGCIPSKALLRSTEYLHFIHHRAAAHGIKVGSVEVDVAALMSRKNEVVSQLRNGIAGLARRRKVDVLSGHATLKGGGKVEVRNGETSEIVSAREIIVATGSSVIELPFLKFDGQLVVSSDHAIAFDRVPSRMIVIGAGAIGLELGSVWSRMGADVTVVEMFPQIAPSFDEDVARSAQKIFEKQGLKFILCAKVTGMQTRDGKHLVSVEKDGITQELEVDKVLVAVGRKPNTAGLGADEIGLARNPRGFITVDAHFNTNIAGIRAIGDVTPGPMLAHKAEEEGVAVAEMIAGKHGHVNYDLIPGVVYTDPEIAIVGLTEAAAKEKGLAVKTGKFNFAANGRAIANDTTDGFVKVIADAKTDRILGAQILGHNAGELLSEVIAHMEYGGSAEDLGRTVHSHPTMGEAIKEAALAVDKNAIHAL